MTQPLPPYISKEEVASRLPQIFPEGFPYRQNCIREAAARTVFALLYIGAVEGSGRRGNPVHTVTMTSELADNADAAARNAHYRRGKGYKAPGTPWYAMNSRESVRDEALRDGLFPAGAIDMRTDLAPSSSLGRYALKGDFAALFDPALVGPALASAIAAWQRRHLSAAALARIQLVQAGTTAATDAVLVKFPDGTSRRMSAGPSSHISKHVIETFAPRFLANPAVLWLSESGNKVVARDDKLMKQIGLKIDAAKLLPDMILADVGQEEILLVFVEAVATAGPINAERRAAFVELAGNAGFTDQQLAFVTAFEDRSSPAFTKEFKRLAWDTFAWLVSEPECLIDLRGSEAEGTLAEILGLA